MIQYVPIKRATLKRVPLLEIMYAFADCFKHLLSGIGETLLQGTFDDVWEKDHYDRSDPFFVSSRVIICCTTNVTKEMHVSQNFNCDNLNA